MPRVAFYFTHYQCLGHTTRVLSLVAALKAQKRHVTCDCFWGSLEQPYLDLKAFENIHVLPYPLFSRDNFRSGSIRPAGAVQARAAFLLKALQKKTPDIFITEYFPIGRRDCYEELLPSLMYLARQGVPVYASAGYPVLDGQDMAWRTRVLPLFKRIFIHSPEQEMRQMAQTYPPGPARDAYRAFFKDHADKICFTGYVVPKPLVFKETEKEARQFIKGVVKVLVTRGAGAYHQDVFLNAIRAGDILGRNFVLTAVAGPTTTDAEWQLFNKAVVAGRVKNVQLIRSTPRFEELLKKADVCVSPAPYNTSVMLLKHGKRAVIIPMQGEGRVVLSEQPMRARMLKAVLGSVVLLPAEAAPEKIAQAVKKALKAPLNNSVVPQTWLRGNGVFAHEVFGL
ncbi:MAG: hypothetical protein HQL19_01475 [Candidatus Omnitrophica bacterium]|nr:hypothetical protein [Candidatus Omnitrophota bacterium]